MHDLDRLEPVYFPHRANLDKDLFLPIAKYSTKFDCMSGYFTGGFLKEIAHSLSCYLSSSSDKKMRFIIGPRLSSDSDIEAFESAIKQKKNLFPSLFPGLELTVNNLQNNTTKMLCYLIASNRLELKIAYMAAPDAIFHPKTYLFDTHKGSVAVAGGANATKSGMTSNGDQLTLTRAWRNEDAKQTYEILQAEFDLLWSGKDDKILCEALNESTIEHIKKINSSTSDKEKNDIEEYIKNIIKGLKEEFLVGTPIIPKEINGNKFSMHKHQVDVLRTWFEPPHDKCGLFKLATGAGKTITALCGVSKIFQKLQQTQTQTKLLFIVAVPYVALAEQWVKDFQNFNMRPIKCYGQKSSWDYDLAGHINSLLAGATEFVAVIVVNNTLRSSSFQKTIKRVREEDVFFVGDECHRHSGDSICKSLPSATYKIGLSATPYNEEDETEEGSFDEGLSKERLTNYYGKIVGEPYGLDDAMRDGILCGYNYHIHAIYLSEAESENYMYWSRQIGRQINIKKSKDNTLLQKAIRERNKIVANAEGKLSKLNQILASSKIKDKLHTLFYVGEGKAGSDDDDDLYRDNSVNETTQLQEISKVVEKNGWSASKFTAQENSSARKDIMSLFLQGKIDALVSMRVLDEGIDIPKCKRAFILASSRNSRQFIQRRGRILRKHDGKKEAYVYDFLVLPHLNYKETEASIKLVRNEIKRAKNFIDMANNKIKCQKIAANICEEFNFDYWSVR